MHTYCINRSAYSSVQANLKCFSQSKWLCQRRPTYLRRLCVPVEDVRGRPHLRFASTRCILLPQVQTSTGQRSFAYSRPVVWKWNDLPPALRENMSLAAFKSKLKTYLFSRLQWLMMATRRCYGVFLWFRRRNINDFTYLLTFDCYRPRWPWMTLSGVIALISRFFTEFDCFAGQICHSGWRWTYYVRKYCLPVPVFHFWP